MRVSLPARVLPLAAVLLAACGGGGGGPAAESTPTASPATAPVVSTPASTPAPVAEAPPPTPDAATPVAAAPTPSTPVTSPSAVLPPDPAAPTDAQRKVAATATAQSAVNACNDIRPFYWEIGDRDARAVSGSENAAGDATTYLASSTIAIASASKWLYASYVAQRLGGVLSDRDRKFLTMRSGNVDFQGCSSTQTVDSCLASPRNGGYRAETDGRFFYDGGHMQAHASLMGLGAMGNRALTAEFRAQLGSDVALAFAQPQPPGGIVMSPDAYALVLRKMLSGQLQMGAMLGTTAVCTNSATCGTAEAVYTPVPSSESWHYAIGHWVEDDPIVGDGAFSSAGAFGFYPWIDASRRYYGIVARVAQNGSGYASAKCGRLVRQAWLSGVAL